VNEIAMLAIRGLIGGTMVVVFALVGQVVTPKAFSGLFSAAPSVAVASLALTVGFYGPDKALQASTGMVVGGVAMVVCCVLGVVAIPRLKSVLGSLVAWAGWLAVDLSLYWAVFVGGR
jgi:hypothetical protein